MHRHRTTSARRRGTSSARRGAVGVHHGESGSSGRTHERLGAIPFLDVDLSPGMYTNRRPCHLLLQTRRTQVYRALPDRCNRVSQSPGVDPGVSPGAVDTIEESAAPSRRSSRDRDERSMPAC